MAVTHDNRARELVNCDGCARLTNRWHRLAVTSDGGEVVSVRVCRACETYAVDAVRLTLRAVMVKP